MPDIISKNGFARAGLIRRIAAIIYDSLVVCALALAAAAIGMFFLGLAQTLGLFTTTGHQDLAAWLQAHTVIHILFQIYVLSCVCYFYIWFWSQGGQTVGMKAWRLRIQNESGHDISKKQALIRLASSVFGLGNLWLLFAPKYKLALQDYVAKCEVVVLTKDANQHKNWQKLY
ncbi:hypothetical protein C2869_12540 [Saccharobesus litoralis]|uniref:RDD domain-containing protein n=1 Tax=Saccharobesus litoralis TaxID=2172099 RepID=A0A2S0VSP9_9ALTE|nr:RDD family protein [Saccharobesus litoralis]AWB67213.1 hypothetical protein C2869_12540 [Saccharobesus litoralis]